MTPDPLNGFSHPVRVPYAHVDQMGFVYYANYLVYFEMARSAMMREAGLPYGELEKRGIFLPVLDARCQYKKPAHFDDLLIVRCLCRAIRKTRLHIDYEIKRDGDLLVTGYTEHVCVSPERKVSRLAPELMALVGGNETGE